MSGGNTKTLLVSGYTEDLATKSVESLTKSGKDKFSVDYAHKNDLAEQFAGSLPSMSTQLRPAYIIWDWKKCPIPYYYKPEDLYTHTVDFLKEKGFCVTGFVGFGDVKTLNDDKYAYLKEHEKNNIELIHVPPSTNKDEAAQAAKNALLQYVCDKQPPCPIILLTGDQELIKIISSVREKGFEVYLGYNKEAVAALRESATEAWNYYSVFGVDEKLIGSRKRKRKNKKYSQAKLDKRAKRAQAYKQGQGQEKEMGEGSASQA